MDAEDFQARVLRTYTALYAMRPTWAGALVLNIGLDPRGAAVSLATNVAGGVCLSLEQEPMLLRNAMRSGSCDFVVNTLDEAVRAMKNEVRKRVPLSVGLEGDPVRMLEEIVERGLAPEVFTGASGMDFAPHFESLGAVVSFDDSYRAAPAAGQKLHTFTFAALAELRAFDARATTLIPADDVLRHRWQAAAPKLFPRDRYRVLWLSEDEAQALGSGA